MVELYNESRKGGYRPREGRCRKANVEMRDEAETNEGYRNERIDEAKRVKVKDEEVVGRGGP